MQGGLIAVFNKVKNVAGDIKDLITQKKDENKKASIAFCVATGTISKTVCILQTLLG